MDGPRCNYMIPGGCNTIIECRTLSIVKRSGGLLCYIKEDILDGIQQINGIAKNEDG